MFVSRTACVLHALVVQTAFFNFCKQQIYPDKISSSVLDISFSFERKTPWSRRPPGLPIPTRPAHSAGIRLLLSSPVEEVRARPSCLAAKSKLSLPLFWSRDLNLVARARFSMLLMSAEMKEKLNFDRKLFLTDCQIVQKTKKNCQSENKCSIDSYELDYNGKGNGM